MKTLLVLGSMVTATLLLTAACSSKKDDGTGGTGGTGQGGTGAATTTTTHTGTGGGTGGNCATSTSKVDCATVCAAVVAASCSAGPPTVNDCVTFCEQVNASNCPEWGGYADCIGSSPTLGCNAEGSPSVAGCEAQEECMQPCLQGGGGGGGGK